jgi:dTMP kinase
MTSSSALSSLPARGRFITFEGIDGAGKSTHIQYVVNLLRRRGLSVVLTREPGGTPAAEALREVMLQTSMTAHAEVLVAFAARADHISTVIRPALAAGKWVVSDRFTDSTFAYQGGGRGVDWNWLKVLEAQVQGDCHPNLTIWFDLPAQVAAQRRAAARAADRFEQEELGFFQAVSAGYRRRMDESPDRFVLINAEDSVENIKKTLENYFASY